MLSSLFKGIHPIAAKSLNLNLCSLRQLHNLSEKMNLQDIIGKLDQFAPIKLGESWDNIGLLIEPPNLKFVKSILLTNDLTLQVMKEAEDNNVDMILSYHPPIFQALKKITQSEWKQQIVSRCLARGIALYSPHTSWDSVKGGVNDWLIEPFEGTITPVEEALISGNYSYKMYFMSSAERSTIEECLKEELDSSNIRLEHNYDSFSFLCTSAGLQSVLKKLEENPNLSQRGSLNIVNLEKVPLIGNGMGRTSKLSTSLTLSEAIMKVKEHTGLTHVRVAVQLGGTLESEIRSVSVCAGAGSSVLSSVSSDLILTGEMSHHQVLDFTQKGQNVILTEHSNSERGFLKVFKGKLERMLEGNAKVYIAASDHDPLIIV